MGEGMLFYKLGELADKWEKTVDDILQMVLDEKMTWWVQKPELFFSAGPLIEDFDILEPVLAKAFMIRSSIYIENYYGTGGPCKYYLEDFVIFPEEVARVEAKYPELFGPSSQQQKEPNAQSETNYDDYIVTNDKIASVFGWSFNTIVSWSKKAGCPIVKDEQGKNMMKSTDILKVKAFHKKYARE